jgi:hypothetical protein
MKPISTVDPTTAQLRSDTNPNHFSPVDMGLASFLVALPLFVVIGVAAYRNYRSRLLYLQISTLERMWNLQPQEKH